MIKTVSLFIPCTVDLFLPEIGVATYRLLNRWGCEPVYHREQTCCGQMLINAGRLLQAKKLAKHFLQVFDKDEYIVSPSGSCVCTVKYHYPELFEGEPDWRRRAEELGGRIYELSQFMVDVLKIADVGGRFVGRVAYHESCHILRGLGISYQPKGLIKSLVGAELVDLPFARDCCGFGGEFSLDYPEISLAMVEAKAEAYLSSRADILVLSEPGCLLNIGGYLRRNHPTRGVIHLANLLDQALEVKDS